MHNEKKKQQTLKVIFYDTTRASLLYYIFLCKVEPIYLQAEEFCFCILLHSKTMSKWNEIEALEKIAHNVSWFMPQFSASWMQTPSKDKNRDDEMGFGSEKTIKMSAMHRSSGSQCFKVNFSMRSAIVTIEKSAELHNFVDGIIKHFNSIIEHCVDKNICTIT